MLRRPQSDCRPRLRVPNGRRLCAQTTGVPLHRPGRRLHDPTRRRHRLIQRPLDRVGARRADGPVRRARLRTSRAHPLGAQHAPAAPRRPRRPAAHVPRDGRRALGRPGANANTHRGKPRAARRTRARRGRRVREAPQEGFVLQIQEAAARQRDDRPRRPGPFHHHPGVRRRHGRHRQARQPAREADRGGSRLPAPRTSAARAQSASRYAGRATHRQPERHDGPHARLNAERPPNRPDALPDARHGKQAATASLVPQRSDPEPHGARQ